MQIITLCWSIMANAYSPTGVEKRVRRVLYSFVSSTADSPGGDGFQKFPVFFIDFVG